MQAMLDACERTLQRFAEADPNDPEVQRLRREVEQLRDELRSRLDDEDTAERP